MELIHANMGINLQHIYSSKPSTTEADFIPYKITKKAAKSVFFSPLCVSVWKKATIVEVGKERQSIGY